MALRLHLTDLLPSSFEFIVGQSTGKDLVDLEREAIFQALLNSVRWSVLRRARAQTERISITSLETSDRFAGEWMSRTEIVARVEHTSGLGRAFAHLALFLIETRLDLSLSADQEGEVSIDGLGTIRSLTGTGLPDSIGLESYWRRIMSDFFPRPARRLRLWSRRGPQWSDDWQGMVSTLLPIEVLRSPLPYRIELAQNLAFRPAQPTASAETLEWPQTRETTFEWGSGESHQRPEQGADA